MTAAESLRLVNSEFPMELRKISESLRNIKGCVELILIKYE